MSGVVQMEVAIEENGLRLDRWFRKYYPAITQGRLQKLLRTGQVRVNGGRITAGMRLKTGQVVRIPPLKEEDKIPAKQKEKPNLKIDTLWVQKIHACILYRDDDILIINKPTGLAVQGGVRQAQHLDGLLDTLVFDADERPRLVHRLDKDTSGVLVLARNVFAARKLANAFRAKTIRKLYWAIVVGIPKPRDGFINLPLSKLSIKSVERMAVNFEKGKKAQSVYRVIDSAACKVSWLALEPCTGRTHQLRVHCAELGTPILGDGKYGKKNAFFDGEHRGERKLHLHARALLIPHPNGENLKIYAPLPEHMLTTWSFFEFNPETNNPAADFNEHYPAEHLEKSQVSGPYRKRSL